MMRFLIFGVLGVFGLFLIYPLFTLFISGFQDPYTGHFSMVNFAKTVGLVNSRQERLREPLSDR